MRQLFCILLTLSPAAAAAAQERPEHKKAGEPRDAREILREADAAARRIQSARYTFEFAPSATGAPMITGTAILGSGSAEGPKTFYMDLRIRQPTSPEARHVTLGSDGETTYAIDHARRTVYADRNPAVLGSFVPTVRQVALIEYVHPAPFRDEIEAEKAELRGRTRINEEECWEIAVKYKGATAEAVWFFSVRDSLPRRVDRILSPPDGGEMLRARLVVLSLEPDPRLDPEIFRLKVPEGYTRTGEPAP